MQNSDFRTGITSLYGSQTSPVALCNQNRVISTRNTSSHGPRPHLSFCACKTTWLASEWLVSMGPALTRGFCIQNNDFWTRITSLYGSQTSPVVLCNQNRVISTRNTSPQCPRPLLSFCACKTAWFAPELIFSMVPSPHLWFLNAKQRLLVQNYKSVLVQELTCRIVHAKQRD